MWMDRDCMFGYRKREREREAKISECMISGKDDQRRMMRKEDTGHTLQCIQEWSVIVGMDGWERYGKEERKINLHDLICR